MKNLHAYAMTIVIVSVLACLAKSSVLSQALAEPERAKPVAGNPGISSMAVTDQAQFRVLRNYAEPGATRQLHSHDDASYHVFVLVTGALTLTIEGQAAVTVTPGETLTIPAGAKHTFTNTGKVTSTIVEVFGKK